MENLTVRQFNSIIEAFPKTPEMQGDKRTALIVAMRAPQLLSCAKEEILHDEEVALVAVKTDGQALRVFPEDIRGNEKVVLVAVENFCKSFAFAVGKARESLEIAKTVARRGVDTIALLDQRFLNSVEVAKLAVERNPKSLKYFSEEVRSNEEIALFAISKDRTAIEFVGDSAFKSKKIFEKAVCDYNGKVRVGCLSNLTPQGVFDEIERRGITFTFASQNIDLMTLERDKLLSCLKQGVGAITKKSDLLRKYILAEDREIITLIIERGSISQRALAEDIKFASKNSKIRVLPLLLKYIGGTSAMREREKDERMYEMRSLRRKSPVAVQRFKDNYQSRLADREVVMLAASADGSVLKTLSKTDYAKDAEFVSECLKSYTVKNSDGAILEGLDLDLTYEQAEIACKKDGRNYFYLSPKLKEEKRLAVLAVASCESVFERLPEEFKTLPEVLEERRRWIK